MNFISVGTITLNSYDWRTFQGSVVGSNVFRITQSWLFKPYGFVTLGFQNYHGVLPGRRIYPSNESLIITIPSLQEVIQKGYGVFDARIKLSSRYANAINAQWTINLEWQG